MNIKKTTSSVMIVRDRAVLIPGICVAAVVVALLQLTTLAIASEWFTDQPFDAAALLMIALCGMVYCAHREEFRFDAKTRRMTWMRRGFIGRDHGEMPLSEIHSVSVHTAPSRNTKRCRIVLTTRKGEFPLSQRFAGKQADMLTVARSIQSTVAGAARSRPGKR